MIFLWRQRYAPLPFKRKAPTRSKWARSRPIQAKVVLASLPGNPVLDATTGDPIPGLTWRKLDADVDGLADDIRIESGPGKLDLRDGAAGSGINGGTCRDGNVPYPNNEIPNSAWIR